MNKVSSLTVDKHITDIQIFTKWLETLNINIANTRLSYYIKFLNNFLKQKEYDPANNDEDKEIMNEYYYVLREVHELMWIHTGLKNKNIMGLTEILKIIVGGHNYAKNDKKTEARNYQLELRIASYFLQKDYNINLSQRTDIIVKKLNYTYYIECKRLYSKNKVHTRIKEAAKQLELTTKKSKLLNKNLGVAVFDVTKIAYSHLGLTWGFTESERQKNIQNELIKISKEYDFISPFQKNKNIILIWIQIMIPSINLTDGTHETRFSSYFIPISSKYSMKSKPFKLIYDSITDF